MDDCTATFGDCAHNGRQTHYHCMQVIIDDSAEMLSVYIDISTCHVGGWSIYFIFDVVMTCILSHILNRRSS